MKTFKNIDKKLEEIGFKKIQENKYGVSYERENKKHKYIQVVDIHTKNGGLLQSYDKNLFDEKKIGNCCVGLTYYETKLLLKKYKKILKSRR